MSPSAIRVRTGCENCRARHLKCDEEKSACSRCRKAGIECVRIGNIRFRHDYNPSVSPSHQYQISSNKRDYNFSSQQKWCATSRKLNFVNETSSVIDSYLADENTASASTTTKDNHLDVNNDGDSSEVMQYSPAKRARLSTTITHTHENDLERNEASIPPSAGNTNSFERSQSVPTSIFIPHVYSSPASLLSQSPSITPPNYLYNNNAHDHVRSPPTPPTQQWPLVDYEEARLMRYWIDNLAHYLDMCDHQRHFATVVPYRAASCPPLLNAVFATAARHMGRHGKGNPYLADKYHQRCLEALIPLLNDTSSSLSEDLLAAAVLLRFHEEMETADSLIDSDSHLSGVHIFMKAQERSVAPGGLRQAAFWVGLRMDLFFAFMNSRPVLPTLAIKTIDKSLSPADDCTWANRMVATCAEALQYSFGSIDDHLTTYDALVRYCERWMAHTPPSFTPIFYRAPRAADVFPEYWVLSDAIGAGLAHYYLTKILLTAHNPRIPRLGPKQRRALREADEQIRQSVLAVCGIAKSNPKAPPYYVKACMGITMAGDRFTDRNEQEALLKIMHEGADLGWPVLPAVQHLKEAWGWKE